MASVNTCLGVYYIHGEDFLKLMEAFPEHILCKRESLLAISAAF